MYDTLNEARQLVVDCRKWSVGRYFAHADDLATRFSRVNPRIDRRLAEIEPYRRICTAHPVVPPHSSGTARAIIAAQARAASRQLVVRTISF
jgi:hypothetical protein